ncbi:uncharacterized protein JCM15063_004614 [Sporobolomyces koalae]|uniref:uncharacterized protein n=1 Tax=Sporobolomyces koalae TaxID=500713 RepID=UPI003181A153
MFTRSMLFSWLSLLIVGWITIQPAQAAMGQGHFNFTRDYIIKYDRKSYKDTALFCKRFRSACVDYVGPLNQHHILDCVFDNGQVVQKGPKIHAFCGGLPKNKDGTWTNNNAKVIDQTRVVIDRYMNAKIVQDPMGKTACLKFRKNHKE